MAEQADARAKEIEEGCNLPGAPGALYRFIKRADFELVDAWITGEKLRGTSPIDLFQVIEAVIAHIAVKTALCVRRAQINSALANIFSGASTRADLEVTSILHAAKAGPRLTLVKD